MNNSQVTVPRYRENPFIIPFSMLCPGISQNTKHHQLTLYKGQVWGEKSYPKLCDNNILSILYDGFEWGGVGSNQVISGELYEPPIPGQSSQIHEGLLIESSQIANDIEILQSFAMVTQFTHPIYQFLDEDLKLDDAKYQIVVGPNKCSGSDDTNEILGTNEILCHPPNQYYPKYIWTKEGFKIKQIQVYKLLLSSFT